MSWIQEPLILRRWTWKIQFRHWIPRQSWHHAQVCSRSVNPSKVEPFRGLNPVGGCSHYLWDGCLVRVRYGVRVGFSGAVGFERDLQLNKVLLDSSDAGLVLDG